jgi:hypothetical protein
MNKSDIGYATWLYGNVWDLLFNGTCLLTINGSCQPIEEKLRYKVTNYVAI